MDDVSLTRGSPRQHICFCMDSSKIVDMSHLLVHVLRLTFPNRLCEHIIMNPQRTAVVLKRSREGGGGGGGGGGGLVHYVGVERGE